MKCVLQVRSAIGHGAAAVLLAFCQNLAAAAAQAPATAPPAGPGSLSGVWAAGDSWRTTGTRPTTLASGRIPERNRVLRTSAGEWPPLQPWASDELEKRIKLSQEGRPPLLTLTQCLPGMPVLLLGGPYPIQIIESPGQVTMLFEEQNHYRLIYLDDSHPQDPDPTFMGHSVGRWEGNVLVVDTIGFTERTPLDRVGMPHTEALHLIERYRRADPDTMEVVITIDDPRTFTKPWDAKVTYRVTPPGVGLTEYICENNRDDRD